MDGSEDEQVAWVNDLLDRAEVLPILQARGLTQAAVAEYIGVSNVSVHRYLSSRQRPRRETALKLARLLAVLAPAPLYVADHEPMPERACLQAAHDFFSMSQADIAAIAPGGLQRQAHG